MLKLMDKKIIAISRNKIGFTSSLRLQLEYCNRIKIGKECSTVKPVLSGYSNINNTKILITNGNLMKVKSIAECSPLGAFCNTFDQH